MSATEPSVMLRSESANQVNDDSAFVFVRYWPGFTDRVPYERLNVLSDKAIEDELRKAIVFEARDRGIDIARQEANQGERHANQLAKWRKSAIAPPTWRGLSNRRNEPLVTHIGTPRQQQIKRIIRHARLIGWHAGNSPVDYVVSPQVWIARVDSSDLAEGLVRELTEFRPEADERSRNQVLNPKFGFMSWVNLSTTHARVHAKNEVQRLRTGDPKTLEIWGGVTKHIIERADRYIREWHNDTMTTPVSDETSGSSATALSQQRNTDAKAKDASPPSAGQQTTIKKSTEKGEAHEKIVSGLTGHHNFYSGRCDNFTPVQVNKFAKKIEVSKGHLSGFFKREFGSHKKYEAACRNQETLCHKLRAWNDESLSPALELKDDYSADQMPSRRRGKPVEGDDNTSVD